MNQLQTLKEIIEGSLFNSFTREDILSMIRMAESSHYLEIYKQEVKSFEYKITKPEWFVEIWNKQSNLPKIRELNASRKKILKTRLMERFFFEHYEEAMRKINTSSFCCGENSRGWTANIDWFIRPSTVAKIIEGQFDNKTSRPASAEIRSVADAERIIQECIAQKKAMKECSGYWSNQKNWMGIQHQVLNEQGLKVNKALNDRIEEAKKFKTGVK